MRKAEYRYADRAEALLSLFEKINVSDKQAERKAKRGLTVVIVSGIAWFFSIFGMAFHALLALLMGVLLLTTLVALVYWYLQQRQDLDDRKVATLLRLLRVLRADVPASEKVAVRVDLRDYAKGGRLLSKQSRGGVRVFRYEQSWLEWRTRLADGNALAMTITDRARRKEKRKHKSTKVTERIGSAATLVVRLDKRYGDAAALAARLERLPLQAPFRLRRVAARGRGVRISFVTPVATSVKGARQGFEGLASGDTLLLALRWFYSGLAAARQAA
jgi:hypothetical protein